MTAPSRLASIRDAVEQAQRHAMLAGTEDDLQLRLEHVRKCVDAAKRASKELLDIADAMRKEHGI